MRRTCICRTFMRRTFARRAHAGGGPSPRRRDGPGPRGDDGIDPAELVSARHAAVSRGAAGGLLSLWGSVSQKGRPRRFGLEGGRHARGRRRGRYADTDRNGLRGERADGYGRAHRAADAGRGQCDRRGCAGRSGSEGSLGSQQRLGRLGAGTAWRGEARSLHGGIVLREARSVGTARILAPPGGRLLHGAVPDPRSVGPHAQPQADDGWWPRHGAGGHASATTAPPAPSVSTPATSPTSLHRLARVLCPCGMHAGALKQA